jgi:hypothetical protein
MSRRSYSVRPGFTFASLGVVHDVHRRMLLRVAASRTTDRDAVTLTVKRKFPDGRWVTQKGIGLSAESIPHLIHLLTRAVEALPELPLPPEAAPRAVPSVSSPGGA